MKVFVAGATGAIGKQLVPMLVEDGHEVTAMTRTPAKADAIRSLGLAPPSRTRSIRRRSRRPSARPSRRS